MENYKKHWETVFETKAENEVSWYQENPQSSIDFIIENQANFDAKIIDIGGGDSYFIDKLIDLGYKNLTLLDISENAINRAKKRLGSKGNFVNFIINDILDFKSETPYEYWHDRASFHFLINENQIQKYAEIVSKSIAENGKMLIGTFNENGPKKCSGLEITQYSEQSMNAIFEKDFELISSKNSEHKTPFDTIQNFIFCQFRKL